LEEDLKEKILGTNAHIVILKSTGLSATMMLSWRNWNKVPGVVASTPFIYNQSCSLPGRTFPGGACGESTRNRPAGYQTWHKCIIEGKAHRSGTPSPKLPCSARSRIVRSHHRQGTGRKTSIFSRAISQCHISARNITPLGMMPQTETVPDCRIFNTGMFEYDSTLAYVSLAEAQSFVGINNTVTGISRERRSTRPEN